MDESTGEGQGDENPENKAVKPELSETGSGDHKLPVRLVAKFVRCRAKSRCQLRHRGRVRHVRRRRHAAP